MSEAEEMAKRLERLVIMDEVGSDNPLSKNAASLLRSQAAEIEALKAQLATARNDALEEAAKVGRKAVMSFKGKVGGKYYAGYHEDMREYVAAAVRKMKEG